jgi:hypothetical protein
MINKTMNRKVATVPMAGIHLLFPGSSHVPDVTGSLRIVADTYVCFAGYPFDQDLIQFTAELRLPIGRFVTGDEIDVKQITRFARELPALCEKGAKRADLFSAEHGLILRLRWARGTSGRLLAEGSLAYPFGTWKGIALKVIQKLDRPFPCTITFAFLVNPADLRPTAAAAARLVRRVERLRKQHEPTDN